MPENIVMNTTTMLGTYTLDGDAPVEPEIVLANCSDTAMLGQLVTLFEGNPDIRFFLLNDVDESAVDLGADFFFLKDHGNWVLANHDSLMDVMFDDAGFNPTGTEATFSLAQADDGSYSIAFGDESIPSTDSMLVDSADDDLFVNADVTADADSFYIDPSVLAEGESEIVVSNFTVGTDVLELGDGMAIRNVVVDNEHDLTEVIVGQSDTFAGDDDIVVKLLGVSQPDLNVHDYGMETDNIGDDLINQLINSAMNVE